MTSRSLVEPFRLYFDNVYSVGFKSRTFTKVEFGHCISIQLNMSSGTKMCENSTLFAFFESGKIILSRKTCGLNFKTFPPHVNQAPGSKYTWPPVYF